MMTVGEDENKDSIIQEGGGGIEKIRLKEHAGISISDMTGDDYLI